MSAMVRAYQAYNHCPRK